MNKIKEMLLAGGIENYIFVVNEHVIRKNHNKNLFTFRIIEIINNDIRLCEIGNILFQVYIISFSQIEKEIENGNIKMFKIIEISY